MSCKADSALHFHQNAATKLIVARYLNKQGQATPGMFRGLHASMNALDERLCESENVFGFRDEIGPREETAGKLLELSWREVRKAVLGNMQSCF